MLKILSRLQTATGSQVQISLASLTPVLGSFTVHAGYGALFLVELCTTVLLFPLCVLPL